MDVRPFLEIPDSRLRGPVWALLVAGLRRGNIRSKRKNGRYPHWGKCITKLECLEFDSPSSCDLIA